MLRNIGVVFSLNKLEPIQVDSSAMAWLYFGRKKKTLLNPKLCSLLAAWVSMEILRSPCLNRVLCVRVNQRIYSSGSAVTVPAKLRR